jgi:hypothetical protein
MPAPIVPALPPRPIRGDRLNFPTVADNFVAAMDPWGAVVQSVGEFAEARANDAETAQDAALAAAAIATASADIAGAVAGFAGLWEDLTGPLSMPASVAHDDAFWILLEDVANVAAHEPGVSVVWGPEPETPADKVSVAPIAGVTGTDAQAVLEELSTRTLPVATQAEAQAGTVNDKAITPLRLRDALNSAGWLGLMFPLLDRLVVAVTQVSGTYSKTVSAASASWTVSGAPAGTVAGDTVYVTITSGGLDPAYSQRAYTITSVSGSTASIGTGFPLNNPNTPSTGSGNATLRYVRHLRRGNPNTYATSATAGKVSISWGQAMPEGYGIQCSNLGADSNAVTSARPAGTIIPQGCLINCVVGTALTDPTYLSVTAS